MNLLDRIFGQPSARVVALARLGLAAVFLFGTLADPTSASPLIVPVLAAFVCFAIVIAILTWRDWWMDARLALPTHFIDIVFFLTVVGAPQGYSSPYFLFFVFLLLSPSIRWTWRETAVTAGIVIALYLVVGSLVGLVVNGPFDTRRFIIRSGNLLILPVVLIWFGMRRRFWTVFIGEPGPSEPLSEDTPVLAALRQCLVTTRARQALAYWTHPDGTRQTVEAVPGQLGSLAELTLRDTALEQAFLFDASRDRALVYRPSGRARFAAMSALVGPHVPAGLPHKQGIGIPIESSLGHGLFLLWDIDGLHSDHLPLGDALRSELASVMERLALFPALQDAVIARERLALARDLHDGVVQFLAGSAYKIEAISRSSAEVPAIASELQELKQLMLMEQEDLRSSIATLRKDKVDINDTAAAAAELCNRLSRQWRVPCSFECDVPDVRIPARVHMDLLNIIKESVANAVRHASATDVQIRLSGEQRQLHLLVRNEPGDGTARMRAAPWSIRERMAELGGSVSMSTEDDGTVVSVIFPLPEISE